jgi:hypothetical protein
MNDQMHPEPKPPLLVVCSCGWRRECISGWAAESDAKLHPRLSVPGTQHTIAIRGAAKPGRAGAVRLAADLILERQQRRLEQVFVRIVERHPAFEFSPAATPDE